MKNLPAQPNFLIPLPSQKLCEMKSYKNKHSYIQVQLTIRTRYIHLRVRSFISLRRILLFV